MYDASYTSNIEIAVIKEVELDRLSLHIYRGVQVTRNANQEVLLYELVQMIRTNCEEVEPGVQVFYKALNEEGYEEWVFAGIDQINSSFFVPYRFSFPRITIKFRLSGKNSQAFEEQQNLDSQNNAFDDPFLNLIIEELNQEMESESGTLDSEENEYCDFVDDESGHNY